MNEVNSITLPAQSMFQASKFLAKLTDLGKVTRIGKDTSNPLKDVRAQKFPRTDFFKTFTAGRK